MQQASPSVPSPNLPFVAGLPNPAPFNFNAAELDLGYEGAFPFLTENEITEAGLRG